MAQNRTTTNQTAVLSAQRSSEIYPSCQLVLASPLVKHDLTKAVSSAASSLPERAGLLEGFRHKAFAPAQPNSARAWLAPITHPIARCAAGSPAPGASAPRQHRSDHRCIVQVAEDRLKFLQALQERIGTLRRVQGREELDRIAQRLQLLPQLMALLDCQSRKSVRALADLLPTLVQRLAGQLDDRRCKPLGLAKILRERASLASPRTAPGRSGTPARAPRREVCEGDRAVPPPAARAHRQGPADPVHPDGPRPPAERCRSPPHRDP